jgi:CheY-like chemotaxis protein
MSPSRLAGFTIVVVENHNETRTYLGEFLKRMGAYTVLAASATEGLEAINNCLPNLVLTDIEMPEEDGVELLQKIRALESREKSLPVVAMTAMISRAGLARMHKAGFNACLQKPFSPGRLMETVLDVTHH